MQQSHENTTRYQAVMRLQDARERAIRHAVKLISSPRYRDGPTAIHPRLFRRAVEDAEAAYPEALDLTAEHARRFLVAGQRLWRDRALNYVGHLYFAGLDDHAAPEMDAAYLCLTSGAR